MKTISKIDKIYFNGRQRKELEILAIITNADGDALDAINPGTGNHRNAMDWAEWRAKTIGEDYKDAAAMSIYCGDELIAQILFEDVDEAAEMREKIEAVRESLDNNKAYNNSAWGRGVNEYASMLLDNLAEYVEYAEQNGEELPGFTKEDLLNGASDWRQYSYGGCALVYDTDIAETVCSPSELKRCKGGERQPNSLESWLDVQARALSQAAGRIIGAARNM